MEFGITDKVTLITGASRGIGRAIARAFAQEGAKLALCARSRKDLDALAGELSHEHGLDVLVVPADLSTHDGVDDLVGAAMERFGQINVLVNNAGAIRMGGLLTQPDAEWQQDWDLKLYGYVRMMRAVFPAMQSQGGGRVVNIIGSGGRMPTAAYLAGGGANAALMNITKGVAEEGGPHNILVNAINPGPVRTERWAGLVAGIAAHRGISEDEAVAALFSNSILKRPAEPEEVAALAVFLAGDPASYITGEIIQVDGGAARCI